MKVGDHTMHTNLASGWTAHLHKGSIINPRLEWQGWQVCKPAPVYQSCSTPSQKSCLKLSNRKRGAVSQSQTAQFQVLLVLIRAPDCLAGTWIIKLITKLAHDVTV